MKRLVLELRRHASPTQAGLDSFLHWQLDLAHFLEDFGFLGEGGGLVPKPSLAAGRCLGSGLGNQT